MRKGIVIIGLAAALMLGGCQDLKLLGNATLAVVTGETVADVAPSTLADAEKVLTIAHLAVNYIGEELKYNALPPPEGSGLLHGDAAHKARVLYAKMVAALRVGDKADDIANTAGILSAVAQVQDLRTQFDTIAGLSALTAPPGVSAPPTH